MSNLSKPAWNKTAWRSAAFLLALSLHGVASADLTLAVVRNPDESYADYDTSKRYNDFVRQIRESAGTPVKLIQYQSAFEAAKKGKEGNFDMILGPSHAIASLMHAKFTPIAKLPEQMDSVFIVRKDSPITSLKNAKGARLAMPGFESLTTSLARAELNLQNIRPKSYFAEVRYHLMGEAALFGLKNKAYDIAVAREDSADEWLKTNPGRIIFRSAQVPRQGFAIRNDVPAATQQRISAALLKYNGKTSLVRGMQFASADAKDYSHIGSMLNTTPTVLAGARVINVAQGKTLIASNVPVYDVRTEEQFKAEHVPKSIFVPYKEASAKEVDFDGSDDKFDLSKLPSDKAKPLIMYCDGTSCWKSYKSAKLAVSYGYTNLYWMRGGLPEWKAAGYATEKN
jgi:ABC-type phosphate/phosphonate transport system substrate-binding protein/rhodanese-related sulfurtransferase